MSPGLSAALDLALAGRLERALAASRTDRSAAARWLRASIACARGDFAGAERRARALLRAADPAVRARAAITLGSVLRQTGRHAAGRRVDERALAAARAVPGREGDALRAHALIGLGADAVGLADAPCCARMIARAAAAAPRGDWRVSVRLAWVRTEHALMTSRPRAAVATARRALARSERAGARRHVAKSWLFLAAALREAGDPGWREAARHAAALARRIGARPVGAAAKDLLGH